MFQHAYAETDGRRNYVEQRCPASLRCDQGGTVSPIQCLNHVGSFIMRRLIIGVIAFLLAIQCTSAQSTQPPRQLPVATKWVLEATPTQQHAAVTAVMLIYCPKGPSVGSGFVEPGGLVITNHHVVRGCAASDITAQLSDGSRIGFASMRSSQELDLAALRPTSELKPRMELAPTSAVPVGTMVKAWGYPLGYTEPPPLLSVGYVSGFRARPSASPGMMGKRLIVNGAFNSGNSGGPLVTEDGRVIGVVVEKLLPIFSPAVQQIVEAFKRTDSGLQYTTTDPNGKQVSYSEAQLVAEIVLSLREMGQVMLGEAISVEDLKRFIAAN